MFRPVERSTKLKSAAGIAELVYHATVRDTRQTNRNAALALPISIFQTVLVVVIFYGFFSLMARFGARPSAIRGDFILYLLSGIFMFMTHTKAVTSVAGSEGPTSAMMNHAPMNTAIAILSAALSCLYIQTLSLLIVLGVYHVAISPIEIYDPVGSFALFILAWFSGAAVGMVFLAMKPWAPAAVGIIIIIYTRMNMIASGKMFVANQMGGAVLAMFSWNPLFHVIDQARGYIFINYNPYFSHIEQPIIVSLVLIMIGLMGEFYTRKHASISWSAGR